MKPTEMLIREHEVIKVMLNVMEKIAENIKAVKGFYVNDMERIARFLQNYVGGKHNTKEENFLFPAIEEVCKSTDDKTVNIVALEHASSRNYTTDISKSIENCKLIGSNSCASLADTMLKYTKLSQTNIHMEETVLFPFADKVLNEEKKAQILKKFEKHDDEIPLKEDYTEMLNDYKQKYLKTNTILIAEFNY